MQYGMHTAIDLMKLENQLRDRKLKYHYLVADERVRNAQPGLAARIVEGMRSLFVPRPILARGPGI